MGFFVCSIMLGPWIAYALESHVIPLVYGWAWVFCSTMDILKNINMHNGYCWPPVLHVYWRMQGKYYEVNNDDKFQVFLLFRSFCLLHWCLTGCFEDWKIVATERGVVDALTHWGWIKNWCVSAGRWQYSWWNGEHLWFFNDETMRCLKCNGGVWLARGSALEAIRNLRREFALGFLERIGFD